MNGFTFSISAKRKQYFFNGGLTIFTSGLYYYTVLLNFQFINVCSSSSIRPQ